MVASHQVSERGYIMSTHEQLPHAHADIHHDIAAFFDLNYGVYVVSAQDDQYPCACVINTALQVTAGPVQLLIAIDKQHLTTQAILKSEHFCVTPLSEDASMELVGAFGFRHSDEFDKFERARELGVQVAYTKEGTPYLAGHHATSVIECRVNKTVDVGTHLLVIGDIVEAHKTSGQTPMSYAYYHRELKGKTPQGASVFIELDQDDIAPIKELTCSICGHVQDAPGGELPADFVCPVCGAPLKFFK